MIPRHIISPWGWPLGPIGGGEATIITIAGEPILAANASLGMILVDADRNMHPGLRVRGVYDGRITGFYLPDVIAMQDFNQPISEVV